MSERGFGHRHRWRIALRYSSLSPNARLVAHTISTWARADGAGAHPSVEELADSTGLSRRAVFRSLAELESVAGGWIQRSMGGGRGRASSFALLIPAPIDALVEAVLAGAPGTSKRCQEAHGNGARSDLNGATGGTPAVGEVNQEHLAHRNGATGGTVSTSSASLESHEPATTPPWLALGLSLAEFQRLSREERARILAEPIENRAAEQEATTA